MTIVTGFEVIKTQFNGITGSGIISAPGLVTGDVVLRIVADAGSGPIYGESWASGFEPVVTVDDEIKQVTETEWTTLAITAYFLRATP